MLQTLWHKSVGLAYKVPVTRRLWVRSWYVIFSRYANKNLRFMNYGYAGLNGEPAIALAPEEERDRHQIQMYLHVAGQIDLRGRDVLEVGSGRGGGAAYIFTHLGPRSMTGVDISPQSIKFCKKTYAAPGLRFIQGDAEDLKLPDESFDAVLNIESAHAYGSMAKFLSEVVRVLRPGGYLLFAGVADSEILPALLNKFRSAGLELCNQEDIMPNVLRALELDNAQKMQSIQRDYPAFSRQIMKEWANTTDSNRFEEYRTGKTRYICCLLRKPQTGKPEGATREAPRS